MVNADAPKVVVRASKKGGPTRTPTFPGSVVPRAKMTVYSVQVPPSSLYVVCSPVSVARNSSKLVRIERTESKVPSTAGRYSRRRERKAFRGVCLFSIEARGLRLRWGAGTGDARVSPRRVTMVQMENLMVAGERIDVFGRVDGEAWD